MHFNQLTAMAAQVVAATQKKLPPAVRSRAVDVPVCYERRPGDALLAEGWEPDLLGLFVGSPCDAGAGDSGDLPPQILLFLENLHDYAGADAGVYRDEVRLTYLHELGHYLGWDEADLEARGLD
jgi:predicted Zn-dependent protease with MMP-like domain